MIQGINEKIATQLCELYGKTYATKKEFKCVFQLSKTVIFEVEYYTLGNNSHPYFATSASVFCRNKRDFSRCGQCQDNELWGNAKRFWKKWDVKHLKDLTEDEYKEMRKDLEDLMIDYNFMYAEYNETKKPYSSTGFRFWQLVDFSKQTPKKIWSGRKLM